MPNSQVCEYSWIITEDFIGDQRDNDVGIYGPSAAPYAPDEIHAHHAKQEFEMYDDDNILYYRGFYVGPDDESMFGPLEDFGTPNAGCTYIKYKDRHGQWEVL